MPMDQAARQRVRSFHQWVTFAGGCLMIAAALAAAYLAFLRPEPGVPPWLAALAKTFHRLTR